MRTLGIDFGSKRVGIALSDESGEFALPYGVIENNEHLIREIRELCAINEVGSVVVGESKDFKGDNNVIMEQITPFIEKLKEVLNLPVDLHPEFMTSIQAERLQGKNDMLDASAAALILSSYLELKKHKETV
ncbi:MAG: Holliday junction resolvase RuvX [Minisyncoccota bacterium]